MALFPVADSKFYMGGVVDDQSVDFVEADFEDEVWVEVDGWTTMGSSGDAAALITTSLINRGRDVKQKGTKNAGQMQNTFAVISDDPGQIALIAAAQTKNNYAFRVVQSSGAERMFIGLVMNAEEAGGEANTILNLNSTIEINSNIVKVAA